MGLKTKILLGAGGIGLLALACKCLYKQAKYDVEKEIAEEKELIKSAGLNPEKKYDLSGKDNFVKNLFHTLMKDTEENIWDEVLLTVDFELHDQMMWGGIRVIQRTDDTVSFLVNIPPYNKGEYETLGSYKEKIVEAVKGILDNTHVQWKWNYRGLFEYFDDENRSSESGKRNLIVRDILESETASFSDRGFSDGLARMVSYFYDNNAKNLKKIQIYHQ